MQCSKNENSNHESPKLFTCQNQKEHGHMEFDSLHGNVVKLSSWWNECAAWGTKRALSLFSDSSTNIFGKTTLFWFWTKQKHVFYSKINIGGGQDEVKEWSGGVWSGVGWCLKWCGVVWSGAKWAWGGEEGWRGWGEGWGEGECGQGLYLIGFRIKPREIPRV